MGWSDKYKKSINCNNPKGFSQKAHCAGRKIRKENMKLSELKEVIKQVIEARGPSRGFNKLASAYQKEALKHQSMVKDQKRLASAFVAEKDPKKKEKAKKAIIDHHHKVKAQEKKMKDAERDMLKGLDNEKIDLNEKKVSISDILKAVKKGKFPLTINAKMLGKVVKTGTIMSPKEAPAAFMMLQGAYPRADISIVDYRKKEIFSSPPLKENNLNELLKELNISKDDMEKLHKDGEVEIDGEKVTFQNEGSMDWEKNFKWANDKELKVISKFIFMNPKGIDGVIKMSKHKPFAFRRTIQKAAKAGLYKESINEVKVETERYFGKKGIIIMIRDGNKLISAIFKDKKNADKFNRNNPSDVKKLYQLAKKTKFPKTIDEYGQRLDLSFIDDKEARLKGTPEPKDAIDRDIDENVKVGQMIKYDDRFLGKGTAKVKHIIQAKPNKAGVTHHYITNKGTFSNQSLIGSDDYKKRYNEYSGGSYEYTKGDQYGQNSVNEIGVFPIKSFIKGIIPPSFVDTTTRDKKERFKSTLRDLKNTLNHFWKSHKIPYRIR